MTLSKIFVAGDWVESSKPLVVTNPYTSQSFAQTFLADSTQIERALASAAASFEKIKVFSSSQKADWCSSVARGIGERSEEFARLIVAEAGKPITDARREVKRAVEVFEDAAAQSREMEAQPLGLKFPPGQENRAAFLGRFPLGPVLCVTPFNFPLNLVAHKVAPALACGAPFLLKPSPKTPLTALLLARVLLEAGLIPESFSVFPSENANTEKILLDPRVKVWSFTGSAAVGWKLKGLVPKKKVLLELGGNAAVVVEPDSDLDRAVQRIVEGGFGYAGQTCISVQRVFVHQTLLEEFKDHLLSQIRGLKIGDPSRVETQVGPMITEEAAKRVESWVREALQGGAQVLCGGKRNGAFYEPTILTGVDPGMKVSCEEVFGPIVVLDAYSDFAQALQRVNDGPFGLQAGVFTRDPAKSRQAFETLEVGTVLMNEVPAYRLDAMPYGGVKNSGFGREGVKYALEDYTERRLWIVNS